MALLDQIDEFQLTMDKVVELIEETKTLAAQIPEVSLSEAPAKIKIIFDLCGDGVKNLNEAISQAEDIQKLLGG